MQKGKTKLTRIKNTDIILVLVLLIQVGVWTYTKQFKPDLAIVPPVPNKLSIKAISLGDEQFYFRTLAYRIQNAGDTFGRFTALKNYNYVKLYHWFTLLDFLDPKSNFVPALAGYYYSQTQNTPDVIHVVNYLDEHASRDLYNKWWWMGQAVYLANHKLKDKKHALKLAYKLASTPRNDVPLWVKQMPAFIHEQLGEEEMALRVIQDIVANEENIDWGEANFMRYFVEERLKKFMDDHPELDRIKIENVEMPEKIKKRLLEKNK